MWYGVHVTPSATPLENSKSPIWNSSIGVDTTPVATPITDFTNATQRDALCICSSSEQCVRPQTVDGGHGRTGHLHQERTLRTLTNCKRRALPPQQAIGFREPHSARCNAQLRQHRTVRPVAASSLEHCVCPQISSCLWANAMSTI